MKPPVSAKAASPVAEPEDRFQIKFPKKKKKKNLRKKKKKKKKRKKDI